jgi:RNA polymerase sigma-54 factor
MTPQLQQAIKLLQLSNLELSSYVEQELEQNPLLERDDEAKALEATVRIGDDAASAGATGSAPEDGGDASETPADSHDFASADHLPAGDGPLDVEPSYDDNSPSDSWGLAGGGAPGAAAPDERPGLEQRLSSEVTLRRHLADQLVVDLVDPVERMIGFHLLELLDEAGYLAADLAEVAARLGCSQDLAEVVLGKLQACDPPGIFARDLRECLALQLADRDRLDPCMESLLDHLDLLAGHDYARLRKLCRVDEEDFAEMLAEIRALDPKPAERYEGRPAEPVIPDILMRRQAGGGWLLELNAETLPRVLVSADYYSRILGQCREKRERDYLSQQFQNANWLVKAMHQRATTILNVATEIVRQQDGFFRQGVRHLRPLTLREVAEAVSLHESTVSRVTANKYISTPRGTFELRYFFSAAIAGTAGGEHSAEAVRHRIQALIDAEKPAAVLSDDAIVALLRRDGVDIARRTVAKYRETLRIPSSVQRRREKARQA